MSLAFFLLHLLSVSMVINGLPSVPISSATCDETEWIQCSKNLVAFMQRQGFPDRLTDDEMTEMCKKILPETLDCENALTNTCSNISLHGIRNVSFEVQNYVDEVCARGAPSVHMVSTTCDETDWNQCSENLVTFMQRQGFPDRITADGITEMCKRILPETLDCEKALTTKCSNSRSVGVVFRKLSIEAQKLVDEACTRGEPENITTCSMRGWYECGKTEANLASLDFNSTNSPINFASVCIIFKQTLECKEKFADRCFNDTMKIKVKRLFDEGHSQLSRFCTPGVPKVRMAPAGCDLTHWNQCTKNLMTFTRKPEFPERLSDDEMTEMCKRILPETLHCKKAFTQKCFNVSSFGVVFRDESAEAQKLVDKACTRGEPENSSICSPNGWYECGKTLNNLKGQDFSSSYYRINIASICILMKRSFECKEKFADRCYDTATKIKVERLFDDEYRKLLGVCNPDHAITCQIQQEVCANEGVYLKTHSLLNATTQRELLRVCNSTSRYITCTTDYAKNCRDSQAASQVTNVFPRMNRLMKAVCNPGGPLQARYLNYTACYPRFAAQWEACYNRFSEEDEVIKQLEVFVYKRQQKSSCVFELFRRCAITDMKRECGKAIADTGQQVIALLFAEKVDIADTVLSHDNSECSSVFRNTEGASPPSATTAITNASITNAIPYTPLPVTSSAVSFSAFPSFYMFLFLFIINMHH